MENPHKKPAEHLGVVPINSDGKTFGGEVRNGKFVANAMGVLRREVDPTGAIVEHRVRRSPYVHERMHSAGKLAHELYDAAEKFRLDFERAQLSGNYARLDMFKTRSGKSDMSDAVMAAKIRVNKTLEALGAGRDGPSSSQSCVWNVVGCGMTLEGWTHLIRGGGAGMNADKASGILHVSLERMALHYGMIDVGRMTALRQEGAYGRGVKDALEFIEVFAAGAQAGEKGVVGRLIAAAQKRFARFACVLVALLAISGCKPDETEKSQDQQIADRLARAERDMESLRAPRPESDADIIALPVCRRIGAWTEAHFETRDGTQVLALKCGAKKSAP